MADRLTPAQRSANMARIRGKDTKPEIQVRRMLHALGYRFRLHRRDLPGRPDIVLPGRRAAVLVHGCFWHGHPGCRDCVIPATRTEWWTAKIDGNRRRDARNIRRLRGLGWSVTVVWECSLRRPDAVSRRLQRFLGPPGPLARIGSTGAHSCAGAED